MQPAFVVLVVVVVFVPVVVVLAPVVVEVTVSVLPTLHPLATKAASNAAESSKPRLLSKRVFNLLSHAMILIPFNKILRRCLKTKVLYFYCSATTT